MYKIELSNVSKAYGKNEPVIEGLDLKIKEGSFTVLLGPSGCGKSTVLRMIAGLEAVTLGDVNMDGHSVSGIEPGMRDIAMVFQNYALYPTMTVRQNIEFGLKNTGVPKDERSARIDEISHMVGLEEYLNRKPQNLSGGQRQRVALARAIVKKPQVFLMDEPLSNLDAKLRARIRTELIELHNRLGATFVYVTHDQVEAMSMGTDIVLMDRGVIQQQAAPDQLYNQPANAFAARFIGSPPMNVLPRAVLGKRAPAPVQFVGFRPEKARLMEEGEVARPREMVIEGKVLAREMLGDQVLYKISTEFGDVNVKDFSGSPREYGIKRIAVQSEDVAGFDAQERLIGFGMAWEALVC